MATANRILYWVRLKGDVEAINRLRVKVVRSLIAHRITLEQMDATRNVEQDLIQELRLAASQIVQQKCPF
ncbi:MAG: hypothetical protein V3V08_23010 [Nannocystaceae bacterium]